MGVGRSDLQWRLVARLKKTVMTYRQTDGESDSVRHWAARALFQMGSPGSLCAVIPDHRTLKDDFGKRPLIREVCIGILPAEDAILAEIRSTGALQLNLDVTVRDAGEPLEEEIQYGCGCCS